MTLKLDHDSFRVYTFKQILNFIEYHDRQQKDRFDFFKVLIWEAARHISTTIINWSQRRLPNDKRLTPIEVMRFSWESKKTTNRLNTEQEREKVMKKFKLNG